MRLLRVNLCERQVFAVLVTSLFVTGCDSSPAEDRLLTELFKNRKYNRLSRAVNDHRLTLNVQVSLLLSKIVDMDEFHEVLRTNLVLQLHWTDYRLAWNATDYDGLDELYVPPSYVWQPDIRLYNTAQESKNAVDELATEGFAQISPNGACVMWSSMEFSVSHCAMDITWFPFDRQQCQLIYESWKHDSSEVVLSTHKVNEALDKYQPSGEWLLTGMPANVSSELYASTVAAIPFSRATFTLLLQRKCKYYFINLIFPCALLSILAVVTFVLPPDSGERVGLGITVLLSLSVYQMVINEKLPATSDQTPILGIYFTFVMSICAVSVAMTVVVLNIFHRSSHSSTTPLPAWAKRLIYERLAVLMRMNITSKSTRRTTQNETCKSTSHNTEQQCIRERDKHHDSLLTENKFNQVENSVLRETVGSLSQTDQLLTSIKNLLEMKMLADSEERDVRTRSDELAADWIMAALVLDRFFFVVSALCLFIGTSVGLLLDFC